MPMIIAISSHSRENRAFRYRSKSPAHCFSYRSGFFASCGYRPEFPMHCFSVALDSLPLEAIAQSFPRTVFPIALEFVSCSYRSEFPIHCLPIAQDSLYPGAIAQDYLCPLSIAKSYQQTDKSYRSEIHVPAFNIVQNYTYRCSYRSKLHLFWF
jgi:hypothetical protein